MPIPPGSCPLPNGNNSPPFCICFRLVSSPPMSFANGFYFDSCRHTSYIYNLYTDLFYDYYFSFFFFAWRLFAIGPSINFSNVLLYYYYPMFSFLFTNLHLCFLSVLLITNFGRSRGFPTNVLVNPKFQNGKIQEKKERLKNYC